MKNMKCGEFLLLGLMISAQAFMTAKQAFAGSPQGFPINTTTVVGTSSTLVLDTNKDRGYLIIQNNGSGNCQMKFGSAITGTEGLIIATNQNYEAVNAYIKSPLYMKCVSSGSSIVTLEANY